METCPKNKVNKKVPYELNRYRKNKENKKIFFACDI